MTRKGNRPAGESGRAVDSTTLAPSPQHATFLPPADPIPMKLANGQTVAELRGDVLVKHAKPGHMLRQPKAWAWDCHVLDTAEKAGARFIVIICDSLVYRTTFETFRAHALPVNRGFGEQLGLQLKFWQTSPVDCALPPIQLTLFEYSR